MQLKRRSLLSWVNHSVQGFTVLTNHKKIHSDTCQFKQCLLHFCKQKFFSIWEKGADRHSCSFTAKRKCFAETEHWLQHKTEQQDFLSLLKPRWRFKEKQKKTENSRLLASQPPTDTTKLSLEMSPMGRQKSVPSATQSIISIQYAACRFTNHKEFTKWLS